MRSIEQGARTRLYRPDFAKLVLPKAFLSCINGPTDWRNPPSLV